MLSRNGAVLFTLITCELALYIILWLIYTSDLITLKYFGITPFITHPQRIAFTWKRSMKHVHCVFGVLLHSNHTAQSFCAPLNTVEYSYDWFYNYGKLWYYMEWFVDMWHLVQRCSKLCHKPNKHIPPHHFMPVARENKKEYKVWINSNK